MKRELLNLTVFIFIIGIFAIYLGLGIVTTGQDFSDTGGAFGSEMSVLGGFWSLLGMVLTFLGILCFPMGLGVAAVREWGRKNGAVIIFLISALCLMAGLIVAYFDIMESIIYFVLTVLAIICMQLLREIRTLFELGTGSRKRYEAAPTYREIEHIQKKKAIRYAKDAPRYEKTQTVKCRRCGTVNVQSKTHCMMCGKEL
ncbi:MAG: hypothetical protein KKH41_01090 [Candidatus Thermoplasmatota archaeon]|nr:hypothetical protein [Euryarchaeota archaeon]MBU4031542.1 hypothetical protein [Candidatus Thermoplasmatota archaeon]MBU4071803.1 hypothetical protein [Candidatus Thermoplasmatota archaeon]MBU4144905.1 hypothetical protein [Candidatus Thermoplasmatota archaeon]MBU4591157.1 hypothetical protein [Candidatus Thermoplasmatota archaeon]